MGRVVLALWTALALSACNDGAASDTIASYPPATIDSTHADMLTLSSAPGVYYQGTLLARRFLSYRGGPPAPDPNCPTVTQTGDTTTFSGDCTDTNHNTYAGRLSVTGGFEPTAVTYDHWSASLTHLCTNGAALDFTANGTVTSGSGTIRVDVVFGGNGVDAMFDSSSPCGSSAVATLAISYSGTYSGERPFAGGRTTWNGSGRVGTSLSGVVTASTTNEVTDETVCMTTALSGATTVSSNGNVAVLTYQGATSCDPSGTATWTLNGVPQGSLAGVLF